MKFKKVNLTYVSEAIELAMLEYQSECKKCRQTRDKHKEKLQGLIEDLFESQYGIMTLKH